MRSTVILALVLASQVASAGVFVDKGMYIETYLVVGHGKTRVEAMKDAMDAIPKATKYLRYEPNSEQASPAMQCLESGVWTEQNECQGDLIQYTVPLRKVQQ